MAIVAGTGTFGFFSSETVNSGNRFQTGTLILGNSRDATFILSALNMQPGDTILRSVDLSRAPGSTLDMNYEVQRTDITPTVGGLCPSLAVEVIRVDDGALADDAGAIIGPTAIAPGGATLDTFATGAVGLGALNNSGNSVDTYTFRVTFTALPAEQNALQGTSCEVTYTWRAIQQTANEDLATSP